MFFRCTKWKSKYRQRDKNHCWHCFHVCRIGIFSERRGQFRFFGAICVGLFWLSNVTCYVYACAAMESANAITLDVCWWFRWLWCYRFWNCRRCVSFAVSILFHLYCACFQSYWHCIRKCITNWTAKWILLCISTSVYASGSLHFQCEWTIFLEVKKQQQKTIITNPIAHIPLLHVFFLVFK